jgi:hypothetical protein
VKALRLAVSGRDLSFAKRMESRMGLRRRAAVGGGLPMGMRGWASFGGRGGREARSSTPRLEWERNERAASQT